MTSIAQTIESPGRRALRRLLRRPAAVFGLAVVAIFVAAALLAPWVAPADPIATNWGAIRKAPSALYWFGTDENGRDLLSRVIYGARASLQAGVISVAISIAIGLPLGLLAGYVGGWIDAVIMRVGDVILSLPTILLALLVSGLARALIPNAASATWAPFILIGAIAIHEWVQYARTVRAATMVEQRREYIKAAKVIGLPPWRIMLRHILPNVMSSVLVIATINLAGAILTEATLSFLGVGMPPTYPSLGTLIRIGNEFVFSGIWWIAFFPALTLVIGVLAVNIVGDWLRDRFNPKLRSLA